MKRLKRLLIVDDTPKPWFAFWRPEPWWRANARIVDVLDEHADVLARWLDSFDDVVYALTPADVYDALEKYRPIYVEIHGHGTPGRPFIGSKVLDPRHRSWSFVGLVWFRACSVAQGKRGRAFFDALTLTCDVVAHVAVIGGLAQSYLVGVPRGGEVWWPETLKPRSSRPGMPRTVHAIERLPTWAFTPEKL